MTLAPLSSDVQSGLDKTETLSGGKTASNFCLVPIRRANPVLAHHISLTPYQRARQVLHPEAFARHLAERVVSPGDLVGFLFAGRIRIDFFVTGCWPCAPAVRITSETTFDVEVNPVYGDQGATRELQEK